MQVLHAQLGDERAIEHARDGSVPFDLALDVLRLASQFHGMHSPH
ncbi:MAG TPA: hypothetical protein VH814_11630 [Steroidobacteraceae bacterium]